MFIPGDSNTTSMVSQLCAQAAQLTEDSILEQLNDFISRGLIHIERGAPILVHDKDSSKVLAQFKIKLHLKDAEYIESLERQIKELNDLVCKLRGKT